LKAPIIFLTTRVQEADRISGLDLGANDYVTEFFSPRELMERVRGLLKFVENSHQDRKRLKDEVDAASQVQQRLFPSSQSPISGVDYAGMCRRLASAATTTISSSLPQDVVQSVLSDVVISRA
jgi:CheY-like chemotaxis protein